MTIGDIIIVDWCYYFFRKQPSKHTDTKYYFLFYFFTGSIGPGVKNEEKD